MFDQDLQLRRCLKHAAYVSREEATVLMMQTETAVGHLHATSTAATDTLINPERHGCEGGKQCNHVSHRGPTNH